MAIQSLSRDFYRFIIELQLPGQEADNWNPIVLPLTLTCNRVEAIPYPYINIINNPYSLLIQWKDARCSCASLDLQKQDKSTKVIAWIKLCCKLASPMPSALMTNIKIK